jgi:Flp pilus assembly protein TadD
MDPDAHHNLGIALSNAQQHEASVESVRRALQLRPRWLEAHLAEGEGLHALGRHDEAVAAFRKALEIDPACMERDPE